MVKRTVEFWNQTALEDLSPDEWEALCDGCAKCCLHKLEDADDGEIYYTDLACHLLDMHHCRCSDYPKRHINVPNCIAFNAKDIANMPWLPDTCAYRLRFLGEPLYDWHYLISGSRDTIHQANESIRGFAERDCGQEIEEHVIDFKP